MKVAALCLGGNTFGWTTDQKASEAVLDAYMEAGGNFIGTADVLSHWAPGSKRANSMPCWPSSSTTFEPCSRSRRSPADA